ncbi:RusA family crossover junction endodeoxyribonuclease [Lactobacillus mellis]|nr:RusA family crossover junction endodeoxyribonuclease [Bombilactobacillus mellis]
MELVINEIPQPQPRPRITVRGKYAHAYEPKSITEYKRLVAGKYRSEHKQQLPLTGALSVDVRFYRPVQKSISKAERQRRLLGQSLPTVKPDIDNYVKAILDALNGLAFKDDSQIAVLYARKIYSDKPRTEIEITEI